MIRNCETNSRNRRQLLPRDYSCTSLVGYLHEERLAAEQTLGGSINDLPERSAKFMRQLSRLVCRAVACGCFSDPANRLGYTFVFAPSCTLGRSWNQLDNWEQGTVDILPIEMRLALAVLYDISSGRVLGY